MMKDLINFGSDEGEQKKQFNKLKMQLETWREVILHGSSVLKWEKPIYPGIVAGIVTFYFLFLWYIDLSVLTLLSLSLLLVCVFDYASPMVFKLVFKPENWTGVQEKRFDEICREIFNAKVMINNFWISLKNAKEQKSTMFIVLVSSVLVILAWIGATVNNLFLSYLMTLMVVNYPGLCQYGITEKVKRVICTQFKSVMGTKTE